MNPKTASSPKEKDFPEEWKALFLSLAYWKSDVSIFVCNILCVVHELSEEKREEFLSFYTTDTFRNKVRDILE